jgi:hypothetical protein
METNTKVETDITHEADVATGPFDSIRRQAVPSASLSSSASAPPHSCIIPQDAQQAMQHMFQALSPTYSPDTIAKVCIERVPGFVERSLREHEARRQNRCHIDATIETLVSEHCTRFVYNPHICRYYEVGKQRMQLRTRTIDSILVELMGFIPLQLRTHRHHILRAVKARISQQHVLEWTPSKRCVERMTQEARKHFGSYDDTVYFMSVVGAIALRRESELFCLTNNKPERKASTHTPVAPPGAHGGGDGSSEEVVVDTNDRVIHLWHGPCVEEMVESAQRALHQTTSSFSPFWNQIKRRMHRTYRMDSLWTLHFPKSSLSTTTPKILKQSPLLWIIACCQHYRQRPLGTWDNHPRIRFTRSLPGTDALFARFVSERVAVMPSSSVAGSSADPHRGSGSGSTSQAVAMSLVQSPTLGPATGNVPSRTSLPAMHLDPAWAGEVERASHSSFSPDATSVMCSPPPPEQDSFLLPREILAEFHEYMACNSLPRDLVTKQELMRLMDEQFKYEVYGSKGSKHLFRGALSVSVNQSVHDLFLQFTQDVLAPGFRVAEHDMVTDIFKPQSPITTRQLHNNYQMWCRHFSSHLAEVEAEQHDGDVTDSGDLHTNDNTDDNPSSQMDTDNHTKYWYCSYTLFETFMDRAFGGAVTAHETEQTGRNLSGDSSSSTLLQQACSEVSIQDTAHLITKTGRRHWNCRVVPPIPLLNSYIAHYQHAQPGTSFQSWLSVEFGIVLDDVTGGFGQWVVSGVTNPTSAMGGERDSTSDSVVLAAPAAASSAALNEQDIGHILTALQHQDTSTSLLMMNM